MIKRVKLKEKGGKLQQKKSKEKTKERKKVKGRKTNESKGQVVHSLNRNHERFLTPEK